VRTATSFWSSDIWKDHRKSQKKSRNFKSFNKYEASVQTQCLCVSRSFFVIIMPCVTRVAPTESLGTRTIWLIAVTIHPSTCVDKVLSK